MIAPQELRLGNLIDKYGEPIEVDLGIWTKINNGSVIYKPIELTEEWILKFGLRNSETGYEIIVKQTKFSAIRAKGFFSVGLAGSFGLYLVKIKYVHQLQNLFFALTGEELKIKES